MKSAPWIAGGLLVFAVGIVVFPGRTVTIDEPVTHPQINPSMRLSPPTVEPGLAQASTLGSAELWRAVDPQDFTELPSLRDDVSGAELFAVDRARLDGLTQGSEFRIPLPGSGARMKVVIERSTRTSGGNRQLYGRVYESVDAEPGNRFVLTLGARAMFGTLSTSAGIFNLSGKDDLAWIIAARALSHHVDPTLSDTLSQSTETGN